LQIFIFKITTRNQARNWGDNRAITTKFLQTP